MYIQRSSIVPRSVSSELEGVRLCPGRLPWLRFQWSLPQRHTTLPAGADHPRACGANMLERLDDQTIHGSSPRMRGKPSHHPTTAGHHRIIPAHAGQTT